jgi:ATPase family associated with various cellular activities (AAA)
MIKIVATRNRDDIFYKRCHLDQSKYFISHLFKPYTKMKQIIVLAEILIALCITLNLSAQENAFMQKISLLDQTELRTIENNLPAVIIREAATRAPGQFNAIILSGNSNINKQHTASYLAQKVNAFVYRVDLSLVVSKNILETEKNINVIFEAAKNKNCVLFFDEGDALFGRRTTVNDAHGRYDNEGTNYFIRQVEKYRSSIIISVKAENNINPLIFEKFVWFSIN